MQRDHRREFREWIGMGGARCPGQALPLLTHGGNFDFSSLNRRIRAILHTGQNNS